MRNERKYKIVSLLSVILAALLLGNCFREPFRMENSVYRQHEEYVLKGAKTYAQNCVQCHGPSGEGVVGMPLNRKDFKVDYETPAGKEVHALISQTLRQGRKASDIPRWEKLPDGSWMSYTTMPAWHRDFGGPLDDDYIEALTLFIMKPDGSQWGMVSEHIPKPDLPPPQEYKTIPLPDAQVDSATNAAAQALLRNVGRSQCLACHTIGAKGGKVGPDLTHIGSWGVDQAFLETWIKYANVPPGNAEDKTPALAHDKRMPVYWSVNRAVASPDLNLKQKTVSEGPYNMPRFKGKLTDEEISLIAKYLMGLK